MILKRAMVGFHWAYRKSTHPYGALRTLRSYDIIWMSVAWTGTPVGELSSHETNSRPFSHKHWTISDEEMITSIRVPI